MQEHENATAWPFAYERCLQLPAHVTCLALGGHGHFYVGSSDGSLRVYDLASFKVVKAIQGLGDEIASIVCNPRPKQNLDDVFLSSGRRIMSFGFPNEKTKLVQKSSDALLDIEVGETEDDVLNELSISANKNYLAFCCDSGSVGVVDLSTRSVSTMKAKHTSICACVRFIPNRPSEILSAGYDHTLHHFDFVQKKLLSIYKISPSSASEMGVSLSPPFIMSTALSAKGIFAVGTADGRIVAGIGGEKGFNPSRNKSKKWEGLKEDYVIQGKVAEGPIVSIVFNGDTHLSVSTLLGSILRLEIIRDGTRSRLETKWAFRAKNIAKVNGIVTTMDESRILIGGLTEAGTGIIEIWNNTQNGDPVNVM